MKQARGLLICLVVLAAICAVAQGTTYEVGPGKPLAAIGEVPWESLTAGDTVLIYWRDTPYKEKFLITGVGTPSQPITVSGVPGPGGELPVLDGQDATTRLALSTGSEARGLITMQQGDAGTIPTTCVPEYIIIENLEIMNSSTPYTFTDDSGAIQSYVDSSAAIWSVSGKHVTVRNCYFHDCGNGLFTYSLDDGAECWTEDWLAEGNYMTACGNLGSITEHDSYCESYKIIYQYNRYGPTRSTIDSRLGGALKDRSAGMVARYNWFEGGNRGLDLVDSEDSTTLAADPLYRETFVYGNVIIEIVDGGNSQMLHYGGDSGNTTGYRKGWLYLYNNTFVTYKDATAVMRMSTNDESTDCRNNIIYAINADGDSVSWLDTEGNLYLSHCWYKPGIKDCYFGILKGTITDDGTSITGSSPGFVDEGVQDFALATGSQCIDAGGTLNAAVLPDNDLLMQYVLHQDGETRPDDGILDIGAFEFAGGGAPADLVITTTSLPSVKRSKSYSATLSASGGVMPYTWSIVSGSLPPGLSLNPATGVISGTAPSTKGTWNFTVQVEDSQTPADTDAKALSITVT